MKKNSYRIAACLLTFAIGVGLVSIFKSSTRLEYNFKAFENNESEQTAFYGKKSFDIEVKFKEFVETEYGLAADFYVTNQGAESAFYRSYSEAKDGEPASIFYEVKVDGKIIYQWRCGTGLMNFEFRPGETRAFRVNGGALGTMWEKGKSLEVGFFFHTDADKRSVLFWSENLPVNEKVAGQLLKDKKRYD